MTQSDSFSRYNQVYYLKPLSFWLIHHVLEIYNVQSLCKHLWLNLFIFYLFHIFIYYK